MNSIYGWDFPEFKIFKVCQTPIYVTWDATRYVDPFTPKWMQIHIEHEQLMSDEEWQKSRPSLTWLPILPSQICPINLLSLENPTTSRESGASPVDA